MGLEYQQRIISPCGGSESNELMSYRVVQLRKLGGGSNGVSVVVVISVWPLN